MPDLFATSYRLNSDPVNGSFHFIQVHGQDSEKEFFFILEMIVQCRFGNVQSLGNLSHSQTVIAMLDEQAGGRGKDFRAQTGFGRGHLERIIIFPLAGRRLDCLESGLFLLAVLQPEGQKYQHHGNDSYDEIS